MPTYRNDSPDSTYSIKNSLGKTVDVPPGASVATYSLLGLPFVETGSTPLPSSLKGGTSVNEGISKLTIFNPGTPDGLTFKPITLPTDSKCIKIQASNGVAGDFTSFATNPPTFHFALTATPAAGETTQHVGEYNLDYVAPSGTIIGYLEAASGVVLSVTVGA